MSEDSKDAYKFIIYALIRYPYYIKLIKDDSKDIFLYSCSEPAKDGKTIYTKVHLNALKLLLGIDIDVFKEIIPKVDDKEEYFMFDDKEIEYL